MRHQKPRGKFTNPAQSKQGAHATDKQAKPCVEYNVKLNAQIKKENLMYRSRSGGKN